MMALDKESLIKLAKITASASPSTMYSFGEDKFNYRNINETLRK